ncbi:MAG: PepSY domain-containing protein [Candidatus Cloacimonetes bacterium]|nr:PepSY domain-containing protein [Candidatus Cloacimonadota bacterium]
MFKEKSMRKLHRVIGLLVTIPMIITICTGLMLIMRSYFPWVQPKTIKQEIPKTWLSLEATTKLLVANPKTQVKDWSDISYFKITPSKGVIQVRTKQGLQVQMNGETGKILEIAPRRTSLIVKIHEGSYWSPKVRDFIVMPSAFGLLLLALSGLLLLFKHFTRRST